MTKPTEKFNISEHILNTSKLGLIRLSVYNSVFNVNRGNNQFLNSETSVEPLHGWAKPISDNKTITPGAYELTEIAELIKEETKGNVIIEPDKKYNEM